jgi:hypothetical protein
MMIHQLPLVDEDGHILLGLLVRREAAALPLLLEHARLIGEHDALPAGTTIASASAATAAAAAAAAVTATSA